MILLIVVHEDKTEKRFGIGDNVQSVIRDVLRNDVDKIVVGQIDDKGNVLSEKIATFGSVMPSSFGKK